MAPSYLWLPCEQWPDLITFLLQRFPHMDEAVLRGRLARVEGRTLTFEVSAHDGVDPICEGRHERVVVDAARFTARVSRKRP